MTAIKLFLDYDSDPRYFDDSVICAKYEKPDAFCRDNKLDAVEVKRLLDNTGDEMSTEEILSSFGKMLHAPDFMSYSTYRIKGDIVPALNEDELKMELIDNTK